MKKSYAIQLLKKFNTINSIILDYKIRAERLALTTHCCFLYSIDEPAIRQVERIERFLTKSKILSKISNAVVEAVNNLDKSSRLLLILMFVRKANKKNILKFFGFSQRTLYRRLNTAVLLFEGEMKRLGFDEEWVKRQLTNNN